MNMNSPARRSSSSDRASGIAILALLAVGLVSPSCKPREFKADSAPSRSLREFDRIEIRPLTTAEGVGKDLPDGVKDRLPTFAGTFPAELRPRIYRKHILNASSGRLLILQGVVTRYELSGNVSGPPTDTPSIGGQVEIEMTFTDEGGQRVSGGRASAVSNATSAAIALDLAEKRAAAAVADYLRKAVKGGEKTPADPPDNP
jgi:hypothetical protein